jgi:hypothetical protein
MATDDGHLGPAVLVDITTGKSNGVDDGTLADRTTGKDGFCWGEEAAQGRGTNAHSQRGGCGAFGRKSPSPEVAWPFGHRHLKEEVPSLDGGGEEDKRQSRSARSQSSRRRFESLFDLYLGELDCRGNVLPHLSSKSFKCPFTDSQLEFRGDVDRADRHQAGFAYLKASDRGCQVRQGARAVCKVDEGRWRNFSRRGTFDFGARRAGELDGSVTVGFTTFAFSPISSSVAVVFALLMLGAGPRIAILVLS